MNLYARLGTPAFAPSLFELMRLTSEKTPLVISPRDSYAKNPGDSKPSGRPPFEPAIFYSPV
jgi:hypothetical protein